jgi:hypothetical protein
VILVIRSSALFFVTPREQAIVGHHAYRATNIATQDKNNICRSGILCSGVRFDSFTPGRLFAPILELRRKIRPQGKQFLFGT